MITKLCSPPGILSSLNSNSVGQSTLKVLINNSSDLAKKTQKTGIESQQSPILATTILLLQAGMEVYKCIHSCMFGMHHWVIIIFSTDYFSDNVLNCHFFKHEVNAVDMFHLFY